MLDMIDWLMTIERMSGTLYSEAAGHFRDDMRLSQFLARLATDEATHLEVMESLAKHVSAGGSLPRPAVIIDSLAVRQFEDPLRRAIDRLSSGSITPNEIIDCIATIESSEWNDIFLYVVNSLKSETVEFQSMASRMQAHRDGIEDFIRSVPEYSGYAEQFRRTPSVWNEHILLVDDEPSIIRFLSALLSETGIVQAAENGAVALEKMRDQFFDIILTDVNMPVMDGFELYRRASAAYTDVGKRFIFFSGSNPEELDFFRQNNLAYLTKPVRISEIEEKVQAVLRGLRA